MQLGKFETDNVYNVDCYKAIKDIPDKSIDCIYTDIPYLYVNGGQGHSEMCVRTARKKEELKDISRGIDYTILDDFVRIMKRINIYIWCSKMQLLDIMNYFNNLKCNIDLLVWCKDNPTPQTNNVWLPDLEYCIYARESGVKLNDGYELKSKWFSSSINKRDKDKFAHPTIKPIELVKRHLLHTTQPNDIVLDCFMGSGTTCVACKDIGRRYIGFEIEKKWYDIAVNRLNKVDANGQMGFLLS
jgi:DNA modification methylase